MNGYFFDKANAQDRAQQIRQESEKQQVTAQYTQQTENPNPIHENRLTVIRPLFARAVGLSIIVIVIALMLLISVSSVAEAQYFDPGEGGGFSDALLVFTLGNVAYVRGNYERAHELFAEAIDMIPPEIFEHDPNYAHMYAYLGKAQVALGLDEDALESYTLYVAFAGEYADPRVVELVEAARS